MSRLPTSFAKHLKPVRQPQMRPPAAKNGVEEALRRAKEHYDRGEVAQAEKLSVAILTRDPHNVPALMLAGRLRAASSFGLAVSFFKKVVALQPNSTEAHLVLATAYGEAGEHPDAIKHFRRVLARKPDLVAALGALGKSYTAAGEAELALPLFERATRLQPNHTALRYDHATALIALGRMDDAADVLRESIARGYRVAASYRSLVDTKKFSGEPDELVQILRKLEESNLDKAEDRLALHHAAGKILNDLGRHEEAVDQFQASKTAAGHGFDITAYSRRIDTLIAAFTPQLLKSKAGFGNPTEVPVFIVGMPRSGTTLIEQICASHPAVYGAGELTKLGTMVRSAGYTHEPNGSIQKPPQALTAGEAQSMAAEYLKFIQRISPSSARIIDKMPHNFQSIGMIALLFPNAKIIHCTRTRSTTASPAFSIPSTKDTGTIRTCARSGSTTGSMHA